MDYNRDGIGVITPPLLIGNFAREARKFTITHLDCGSTVIKDYRLALTCNHNILHRGRHSTKRTEGNRNITHFYILIIKSYKSTIVTNDRFAAARVFWSRVRGSLYCTTPSGRGRLWSESWRKHVSQNRGKSESYDLVKSKISDVKRKVWRHPQVSPGTIRKHNAWAFCTCITCTKRRANGSCANSLM